MNRRKFLKVTAATSVGLALPGGLATLGRMAEAAQGPDLVVAKGASTPQVVRAALDAMGGMRRFIAKGDLDMKREQFELAQVALQLLPPHVTWIAAVLCPHLRADRRPPRRQSRSERQA